MGFDDATSAFLEAMWSDGEPMNLVTDALASLQFHMPCVRGRLSRSWKLLKAWEKMEPPTRSVPISASLVLGFAGVCIAIGCVSEAAILLVGFDCFLRSGELFSMRVEHINFFWRQSCHKIAFHENNCSQEGRRNGGG